MVTKTFSATDVMEFIGSDLMNCNKFDVKLIFTFIGMLPYRLMRLDKETKAVGSIEEILLFLILL